MRIAHRVTRSLFLFLNDDHMLLETRVTIQTHIHLSVSTAWHRVEYTSHVCCIPMQWMDSTIDTHSYFFILFQACIIESVGCNRLVAAIHAASLSKSMYSYLNSKWLLGLFGCLCKGNTLRYLAYDSFTLLGMYMILCVCLCTCLWFFRMPKWECIEVLMFYIPMRIERIHTINTDSMCEHGHRWQNQLQFRFVVFIRRNLTSYTHAHFTWWTIRNSKCCQQLYIHLYCVFCIHNIYKCIHMRMVCFFPIRIAPKTNIYTATSQSFARVSKCICVFVWIDVNAITFSSTCHAHRNGRYTEKYANDIEYGKPLTNIARIVIR